jgi:hypothetical protein
LDDLRPSAPIGRLMGKVARLESQLSVVEARRRVRSGSRTPTESQREREATLRGQLTEARHALEAARTAPTARRRPAKPRGAIGCPAKEPACQIGLLGGVCGLPAPLVLAAAHGAPVVQSARYCLTSAQKLIPSHNPQRGFSRNPDYPTDVQERTYDRDKAEQLKVIGIAQNLIPELVFNGAPGAIDGLPVVTPSGIVLGGNGRTMALQLHYAQGGQVARNYLLGHARQFGFTRAQVDALPDPVVVRVVSPAASGGAAQKRELQELVRLLNVPLTQSLDVRAESVAESRRLSDEVLDILSVALDGDISLAEYLSSPASRTLASALRRSGILTDRNAGRLLSPSGDSFSEDGKRFVERLLLAALIPDVQILDRLDGRIRESLARSAPWWLSAAAGGTDWDLRPALAAAAADLIAMRREGAPSVDAYLRQVRMGEPAAITGVPLGEPVLRLLAQAGTRPTALTQVARSLANASRLHPSAQGNLLAEEKLSPAEALARAAKSL